MRGKYEDPGQASAGCALALGRITCLILESQRAESFLADHWWQEVMLECKEI